MKNKVTVILMVLMLTFSTTAAFGATANYQTFNIYDFFSNYGSYSYRSSNVGNDVQEANAQAPSGNEASTIAFAEEPAKNTRTAQASPSSKSRTAQATSSSKSSYEKRVAELVNIERQKNGLAPLTFDSSISNVARLKSKDMSDNNYFAHQSPTYGSAGSMMTQYGIKWSAWGENIASGQSTPEAVVNAWMNSAGHRANILSPNFSKIGVGYVNNGKPYWTQMFTN